MFHDLGVTNGSLDGSIDRKQFSTNVSAWMCACVHPTDLAPRDFSDSVWRAGNGFLHCRVSGAVGRPSVPATSRQIRLGSLARTAGERLQASRHRAGCKIRRAAALEDDRRPPMDVVERKANNQLNGSETSRTDTPLPVAGNGKSRNANCAHKTNKKWKK